MYEIEFYDTNDGKCPIIEFLDSLEPKLKAKTLRTIDLLEHNGTELKAPFTKSLGSGLFELRTKHSSNITRIFYFFYVEKKIILTNGFVKKTMRTPKSDILLAKKYKADYERRNNL
ncbi:MAG: type II toxin-antitoxin system RelE/ParE family toxin [Butyrivibrio sp.]|nr:type II toxin-antitoxin system RelE/ParE family toxin [Butyrivibrio sp.]